ncbi:MAG: hypothetical protein KF900_04820 [Bacteroidetes bacterium]|nr:hypothetical protein [Bacteroidota bacterium]
MNKNWQVFLIHLCVQIFVGVIIVQAITPSSDGHFRAIGELIRLVVMACSFVVISILAFLFVNKEYRKSIVYSILMGGILLLFIPIIIEKCDNALREMKWRAERKKSNEAFKNRNLEVAKQVGLSSYTLNPTTNQIVVKTKDEKQQTFYVNNGRLIIHSNIQPPASNDTLAWLKLSLEEASVYLNSDIYGVLDSCIQVRNYGFRSKKEPLFVSFVIRPLGSINTETKLQGEFSNDTDNKLRVIMELYVVKNIAEGL